MPWQKSILYAFNSDGLYIQTPEIRFKQKNNIKFKTKNIGKAYETESQLVILKRNTERI